MTRSAYAAAMRNLTREEQNEFLEEMDPDTRRRFDASFVDWALDGQRPPPGDWRVWLIMGGRGSGKTRAGAEWVTKLARRTGRTRIALIGATIEEARKVMVEGTSGLLACADPMRMPRWEPSLNRISFRSGVQAFLYSADNPESLRGPEHRYAWCDELAKWRMGEDAWMNLQMGLRQGPDQRVVVTTTPRSNKLLKRIIADPATVRTGEGTRDNPYLSRNYLAAVEQLYAGTPLGRQELDGELIEELEGALWTRAMIEDACDKDTPDLVRIVIGVDPPASARGDACGILVCGLDRAGIGHVLADASVESAGPERWAAAVALAAATWRADRVVAEANNGGDMVAAVLREQDRTLPVALVHASRGKAARAEPVAFLYHQGRVRHASPFPDLEDQMCGLMRGGGYEGPGRSPDRADALVWALTELMLTRRAEPRIRAL